VWHWLEPTKELVVREQPVQPPQFPYRAGWERSARVPADEIAKPLSHLPRPPSDLIQLPFSSGALKSLGHWDRDQAGADQPVEQVPTIPQPFDRFAPRRRDRVQEVEGGMPPDEERWRPCRDIGLSHCASGGRQLTPDP